MKSYPVPKVNSATVEKYWSESRNPAPYSRGTISFIILTRTLLRSKGDAISSYARTIGINKDSPRQSPRFHT